METAIFILIIVAAIFIGIVTIVIAIASIIGLKDYLEVERVFRDANKVIETKSEYKIFTKDDYMKYAYTKYPTEVGTGFMDEEIWNNISKGYNFAIGIEVENDIHFFSVDYFNAKILGGKQI